MLRILLILQFLAKINANHFQNQLNCKEKFSSNAAVLTDWNRRSEAIDKSRDSLLCGVTGIDWNTTYCVDDRTLVFPYVANQFDDLAPTWDEFVPSGVLSIMCISSSPIDFDFYGLKPQPDMQFLKSYHNDRFVAFLTLPFDPKSTGNYSFYNVPETSWGEWIYIFIEKNQGPFLFSDNTDKPHASNVITITISEGNSEKVVTLPCKITNYNFSEKVKLFNLVNANGNKWNILSNVTFDPRVGFILEGISWGKYLCSLDLPPNTDSITFSVQKQLLEEFEENEIGILSFEQGLPICTSKNANVNNPFQSIVNIHTRNPTQSRLVRECLNIKNKCKLTKYDNSLASGSSIINGRKSNCQSGQVNCGMINIYSNGIIMCENSRYSIVEEYFSGMNNKLYLTRDWANDSTDAFAYVKHDPEDIQIKGKEIFYANLRYYFQCSAVSFYFLSSYQWKFRFKNDSVIDAHVDFWYTGSSRDVNGNVIQSQGFYLSNEVTEIMCGFFPWNSSKLRTIGIKVKVLDKFTPKIHKARSNLTFTTFENNPTLNCTASGIPPPKLSWWKNGTKIVNGGTLGFEGDTWSYSLLDISKTDPPLQNNYKCIANNSEGDDSYDFLVKIEDPDIGKHQLTIIIVVSILVILLICTCFIIQWYRQRKEILLTSEELKRFRNGTQAADLENEYERNPNNDVYAIAYNSDFEISKRDFYVDKSQILGCGEFGIVYKGCVKEDDVAVKTVRDNVDKAYLLALLSELKIMIFIEEHENIIRLIGAYTKELEKGHAFVFVEFCPLGSLESFLRKNQSTFLQVISFQDRLTQHNGKNPYENLVDSQSSQFNMQLLMTWSYQIAKGMNYLAEKKVIHGDLATRNVLLKELTCIKITDFGLARQLHNYSVYQKTQQQPLPFKWLAIESLTQMKFSTKSDVWGFGILVWEIFSLGLIPYPGVEWSCNFIECLERGLRLCKPHLASDQLYSLLLKCWEHEPRLRPDFSDVLRFFVSELENSSSGLVYSKLSFENPG